MWQCAIKSVGNHRGGPQYLGPGRPWPARPPTPHFYRQGPAPTPHFYRQGPAPNLDLLPKGLPNPSLLSTGSGPARPTQIPHFYRQGPASPTPHFYWPDPSLVSARADPVTPAGVNPRPRGVPPERPPPICPGLGPPLFGKPSQCHAKQALIDAWIQ